MPTPIPIPADFREHGAMRREELAAHYGVCGALITKWRKQLGIPLEGGPIPRQPPEGFADVAEKLSVRELQTRFRACSKSIRKWRAICGAGTRRTLAPVPEDFATRAPGSTTTALAQHYGCHYRVILRWCEECGIDRTTRQRRPSPRSIPRQHRVKLVPGRVVLPAFKNTIPPPLAGREQDAAQHLRRFFSTVHHCNEAGRFDPKGDFWRVGGAVLAPAEMVAKAAAKGWRADAWCELAA